MIFDNVEDSNVLQSNRPNVGKGSILITCRSEVLAESLTISPIEIPPFTTNESSALILQILNKSNHNISAEESAATKQLSEKLGGLALAIVSSPKT